jgi:hypothetical protein
VPSPPQHSQPSGTSIPQAPIPPGPRRGRTRPLGGANPLLTWVLVGVGAAIVVVLLLVLLAK